MGTPNILTPLESELLGAFYSRPAAEAFFLTRGTALAAFYLHHRYSEDIDLFTLDLDALDAIEREIPEISAQLDCTWTMKVKATNFRMVLLDRPPEPTLKVDLVRDVGPQFGVHETFGNIIVDSELNIAVNKVTAIFGRTTAKDFVDLYFLLQKGYDLEELMRLAKEKDLGFTEFYFAGMLHESREINSLPRMIEPISVDKLHAYFEGIAEGIMRKLKPPA